MLTTNESTSKPKVILRGPTDWMEWHQQFRTRIQQADLADYFDGDRDLLLKPTTRFDPQKAVEEYKTERYIHHYRQEARNRQIDLPDHNNFETTVARAQHNSFHQFAREHSNEDYKDIKDFFLWAKRADFEAKEKEYNKEKQELKTIRNWLYDTVDRTYQLSYFLPDNSLKQWYNDLKGAALQPKVVTLHARTKLLNHVAAIKRRNAIKPDELEQWVREWESLFEQAQQLKVAETTHPTSGARTC
ncbi:hypothetical protein MMYC01_206281 [Madurella mycetomatis]|uniref:Uncharacterized protein n=1 Tax=Madurella mycetomatis TaxID=100816 RepID=A0A175W606_9PEZI|nr:hypothetical protein MMYC01_206281 [Madurella mycetomatis]